MGAGNTTIRAMAAGFCTISVAIKDRRNKRSGCAMAAASGARQAVIVGASGGWQSGAVVGLSDFAPGRAMPLLAWRSEVVMSAGNGV
jgi:hypothetical protein